MRSPCAIDGCESPSKGGGGMCSKHYYRAKRGQPLTQERDLPAEERFWLQVDRHGPVPDYAPKLGPCWIWRGKTKSDGSYGVFSLGDDRRRRVHILAYTWANGPVPDGLVLDHLCRVTLCVNPAHLEPVTRRENTLRGVNPPATNAAKTHCLRGHPFSGDNVYIGANGGRYCRECNRIRARKAAAKRKGAA